jgi:hypothetical protein
MRSLIVITIVCLTSTPAFACVFDTDCKPGSTCVDSVCSDELRKDQGELPSGDANVPMKRRTSKTCEDDSDCSQGSRCIKGSGLEGVCIGH